MTDDDNVYKIEAFIHQAEINLQKKGLNAIKAFRKGENNTTTTLDYAREVHADVIVVMREQVEMTFSFFFGSYAEKMVHESEIPVIVVPN
jgi:nucleotide-binding universal stress UspA family protein